MKNFLRKIILPPPSLSYSKNKNSQEIYDSYSCHDTPGCVYGTCCWWGATLDSAHTHVTQFAPL